MMERVAYGYLLGMGLAWLSLWAYGQVRSKDADRILNLAALLVWVLVCFGLAAVLVAWLMPPT